MGTACSVITNPVNSLLFATRVRRCVPLVEQELLILPEFLSSSPAFSGFRVA